MRHSDFQSRFEGGTEVKIYSDIDRLYICLFFGAKIVSEKEMLKSVRKLFRQLFELVILQPFLVILLPAMLYLSQNCHFEVPHKSES